MSTSSRQSSRVTIVTTIVAALLLAMPLLAAAQATGTIDNAPQDMNAETGEDPTPTSIPPTATATHAVITPTATTVPSPTATVAVETPTPTTTPSPTATATATQDVMTPTATATASPLPNTDTITTKAETTVTLQPGEESELAFTYQVTTPRTGTTIHAELRTAAGGPAIGWTLRGQAGPGGWIGDGASLDLTETDTTTPGSAFTVTFAITAPTDVKQDETVSLFVGSTATTESGSVEIAVPANAPVLALLVTAVAPDTGFALQSVTPADGICKQPDQTPGVDTVGVGERVHFTCQVEKGLLDTVVYQYRLKTSTLSTGWGYAPDSSSTLTMTELTNYATGNLLTTLLAGNSIPIYLGPTQEATTDGSLTVTLQRCLILCVTGWTDVQGASSTLEASLASCSPNVSATALDFPQSKWAGQAYETVEKGLGLNVSVPNSGCTGFPAAWEIQVSTGAMTRDDDGTGIIGTIPANAFYYDGAQSSTALPGISPAPSKLQLGTSPVQIATGTSAFTSGQTWNAVFELQPPNNAPPGNYSGEITITTSTSSDSGG